jgi:hypothetical protein
MYTKKFQPDQAIGQGRFAFTSPDYRGHVDEIAIVLALHHPQRLSFKKIASERQRLREQCNYLLSPINRNRSHVSEEQTRRDIEAGLDDAVNYILRSVGEMHSLTPEVLMHFTPEFLTPFRQCLKPE